MTEPRTLSTTLDRIEQDEYGRALAVLVFDDGEQLDLPLERLPSGAREGSVLTISFQLDPDESQRRRAAVRNLQARLFGPRPEDTNDTENVDSSKD